MTRIIGKSDFDREWERAQRFHRIFFRVILTAAVAIIVGSGFAIYQVATQPEIVGEYVGRAVNGFQQETNP